MAETKLVAYETVTEKPLGYSAYRVRDFHSDHAVDILSEARNISGIPGIVDVSIKRLDADSPGPVIVVSVQIAEDRTDKVRIGMGGWLVLRHHPAYPMHPLDHGHCWQRDLSGRVMFYSDAEFAERYDIQGL